jgi:hypothetical protein
MPKDDWQKNTIPNLFRALGAWPWGNCKECGGTGTQDGEVHGPINCEPCGAGGFSGVGFAPTSVLDVACGLSLKGKFIPTPVLVGLDLHRPYLEAVECDRPWIPICADVADLSRLFLPKTFDLVLLLDIVEHVEKPQALRLIADAEKIAKVAVVIETPKGFLPQNLDILGFDQHHLQTHRCGFEKEELEGLGYHTFARDYQLAPIQRHTSEPIATECQLLNAIKLTGGDA